MMKYKKNRIYFLLTILFAIIVIFIAYPRAASFAPPVRNILEKLHLNLGLDLQGGLHLEYAIDLSKVEKDQHEEALNAIQSVIERRVNAFGVGEPLVQLAESGGKNKIIVELPGIKEIEKAKNVIQETPFLEFKVETENGTPEGQKFITSLNEQSLKKAHDVLDKIKNGGNFEELAKENSHDAGSREQGGDLGFLGDGITVPEFNDVLFNKNLANNEIYPDLVETQFGFHIIQKIEDRTVESENSETGQKETKKEVRARHILFAKQSIQNYPDFLYTRSGLTGKNLKGARVDFGGGSGSGIGQPNVVLEFDDEGKGLFAEITRNNIGKRIAIFLDGQIVSAPVVQSEILAGTANITGSFTVEEAKKLAGRLNEGALPVPIELIAQQSIESSLGQEALGIGIKAGAIGTVLVMIFMVLQYRLFGLIANVSLVIYTGLLISIFKLSVFLPQGMGITLTLSGIAGLILSIGMAADANILIFERTKEEIRNGKDTEKAILVGFKRAWPSIRDGNISTILTSLILIFFASGFIKGFAIILVIGVLVSMFTAITLTKIILLSFAGNWLDKNIWLVMKKSRNIKK